MGKKGKRARIRITPLPYDPTLGEGDWAGIAKQTFIGSRVYGRIEFSGLPEHILLSEAIRFYNYGIGGYDRGLLIDKREWEPFDEKAVTNALADLCQQITNATVRMVRLLALWKSNRAVNLPAHLNDRGAQFGADTSAKTGLLAAHTLLSEDFRNGQKATDLESKRKRPAVYFRKFERLEEELEHLQEYFGAAHLEEKLTEDFRGGNTRGTPDCLFLPQWGGSRVIQPLNETTLRGGRGFSWSSTQPIWPHDNQEVGPTEKLYFSLASSLFAGAHRAVESYGSQAPPTLGCQLLKRLASRVAAVERILPLDPPSPWCNWTRNLDQLQLVFSDATYQEAQSWATYRLQDHQVSERYYHSGVQVGLPCALALIAVLRAYIATLMGYALKVSLPLAIPRIYREVNGYLAVALWEALSKERVLGVDFKGCLQDWGGLVGKLESWRELPALALWGMDEPVARGVAETLRRFMKQSLRIEPVPGMVEKIVPFEKIGDSLPRYPCIRPGLFKSFVDISKHPVPDCRLLGARFFAQVHVFVAMQILAKAMEVTGVKWPGMKGQKNHERYQNFSITAGSYVWAGKKPPHDTHRDGACFDFNFGPNLTAWPMSKTADDLAWFYRSPEAAEYREKQGRIVHARTGKKYRELYQLFRDPLVVCSTREQVRRAEERHIPKNRVIFRPLARKAIAQQLDGVYEYCNQTLRGDLYEVTEEEEERYRTAEENLLGTPHFLSLRAAKDAGLPAEEINSLPSPDDWQRSHIAHAAILLSAPRNIVYGSPIIHLRAMRAIRKGFEDNPEAFVLASEVSRCTYFSFLPWNHHHHWHVDYYRKWWMGSVPTCTANQISDQYAGPVARLQYFFPLWLEMGIDFSPLIQYLESYPLPDYPLPKAVTKEYGDLVNRETGVLGVYQKQYEERYGTEDEPNDEALENAQSLVKRVFGPFMSAPSRDDLADAGQPELLRPVTILENGETKLSQFLQEFAEMSWEFLVIVCLKYMGVQLSRMRSYREEEYQEEHGHQESEVLLEDLGTFFRNSVDAVKRALGF